jgi:hypothetical protein
MDALADSNSSVLFSDFLLNLSFLRLEKTRARPRFDNLQ